MADVLTYEERNNFITLMNDFDKLPPREQEHIIWYCKGLLSGAEDKIIRSVSNAVSNREYMAASIDIDLKESQDAEDSTNKWAEGK